MDWARCGGRMTGRLVIDAGLILTLAFGGCSSPFRHDADATTPVADTGLRPASEVTGLLFSVTAGTPNPGAPESVAVTDPSRAQDVYRATLALPDSPHQMISCPMDSGARYQLTFFFDDASTLIVTLNPGGCNDVHIPGTTLRRAVSDAYWSALAHGLGIAESDIYPYISPAFRPDGGALAGVACATDTDCAAGPGPDF
jgi:hypothetical protein